MSKLKSKDLTIYEQEEKIRSLIVDHTDCCFHLRRSSDDGGHHLMLYLPEEARKEFNIKAFREDRYNLIGYNRVLITFVSEGYVSDLNK
tara:strand:+ start:241 stop:507 length:267 start_codon:yes stop_codon:yes gene_type:complete